jgi:HD-GYP domain-containing protein (c-di-GMP phosphodiesterase class II)
MVAAALSDADQVRTAEVIASMSLATDLAMGLPMEHGLRSALIAMRLCKRMEVDQDNASQAYFMSLLFYIGCNAPTDVGWDVFGSDDAFATYAIPSRFGARAEMVKGMMKAVAPPTSRPATRVWRIARYLPVVALELPGVVAATCEVARMLASSLGLGPEVARLFDFEGERWDGKGLPRGVAGDDIPLPVRIAHVARDTAMQQLIGGDQRVLDVMGDRTAGAFDPRMAALVMDDPAILLGLDPGETLWDPTLAEEPRPWRVLAGDAIDESLAAMGHFSDMAIPEFVGHSGGVAAMSHRAAGLVGVSGADRRSLRRAALVHDLGRVAIPVRIWEKKAALTFDDWEQVRLHPYHTERILARSPFLAGLASTAGTHHERLDGTGYHRGVGASGLSQVARLLQSADAYHAMTEPRPQRAGLTADEAQALLIEQGRVGLLAGEAVAAVLEAAGHPSAPVERPAGLTEREAAVVQLLARGLQTKQVARALEISPKTADSHIQSAYRKMGVSTRAGATLFAMQHGLIT